MSGRSDLREVDVGGGDLLIVAEQCGAQNSGMGVYAFEVGRRVAGLLHREGFRVSVAVRSDAAELADAVQSAGASIVRLGPRESDRGRRMYETLVDLPRRSRGFKCYYSLDHKMPLRILTEGIRVMTIHDVCPLDWPAESGLIRRSYFALALPRFAQSAHRVFTVSECAAERIHARLGIPRDKIVITPNGFDSARYGRGREDGQDDVLDRYGLPDQFFLFVGRVSPRKNLSLVRAALQVLNARAVMPTIVLVGPPGWRDEEDWRDIRNSGLAEQFRRLDYVPPDVLPALYRRCSGLLYPSRCEGFGIPVLEALACGAPVIVAKGTSSAEIGGPFVRVIHPDDAYSLAEAITAIIGGDAPPMDGAGLAEWLGRFSWDRTAEIAASELMRMMRASDVKIGFHRPSIRPEPAGS